MQEYAVVVDPSWSGPEAIRRIAAGDAQHLADDVNIEIANAVARLPFEASVRFEILEGEWVLSIGDRRLPDVEASAMDVLVGSPIFCTAQAIRGRFAMIDYLQSHLHYMTTTIDGGRGAERSFLESLAAAAQEGQDGTLNEHGPCPLKRVTRGPASMHFEDDCTITKDFITKALAVIGDGEHVVQFFSGFDEISSRPGLRPPEEFRSNLAFYLPPGVAQSLVNFRGLNMATGVSDFLAARGLEFINAVPSLVQHTSMDTQTYGSEWVSSTFSDPELENHPYPQRVHVEGA